MRKISTFAAALMAVSVLAGIGVSATTASSEVHELRSLGDSTSSRSIEKQSPSRLGQRNLIAKAMFGGFGSFHSKRYPNGHGWTHAHVGRMARKRKNKARNKRAHRG